MVVKIQSGRRNLELQINSILISFNWCAVHITICLKPFLDVLKYLLLKWTDRRKILNEFFLVFQMLKFKFIYNSLTTFYRLTEAYLDLLSQLFI